LTEEANGDEGDERAPQKTRKRLTRVKPLINGANPAQPLFLANRTADLVVSKRLPGGAVPFRIRVPVM
jgi:hypothetical protein